MSGGGSPLDPRRPAARRVEKFLQRDLRRVPAGGHQQRAVRDAEVHALLRLGAGDLTALGRVGASQGCLGESAGRLGPGAGATPVDAS